MNTNVDSSLFASAGPVTGDIDLKVNYGLDAATRFGLESYNELGPLKHLSTSSENSRILFAVLDKEFGGFDLNLGLGRGMTRSADRWVVKFILGTDF